MLSNNESRSLAQRVGEELRRLHRHVEQSHPSDVDNLHFLIQESVHDIFETLSQATKCENCDEIDFSGEPYIGGVCLGCKETEDLLDHME